MSAHRPLPPQIEQFIHDNPQGILTSFLRNEMRQLRIRAEIIHSGNVDPETRRQFGQAVAANLDQQVDPAIDRIATYVQGPYRARAGIDVGASRHPGGERYYRFLVRARTGLDLTPEAIHQIGLDEVARLERELEDVRRQAGFTRSLSEFRAFLKSDPQFVPKHPREIADALMAAAARIEPKLGDWFGSRPKAPYGAERLSLALEPSMTYGYYQMPTAQDPKGYYLFNGSRLEQRTLLNAAALSYHELVPGHHFQINLARENETLSAFRRIRCIRPLPKGGASTPRILPARWGCTRSLTTTPGGSRWTCSSRHASWWTPG